jgi:E3 ubiquitin-protein ligase RGLG
MNPYKSAISILCQTLASFDDDNLIPTFGFGDLSSKDHSLISFDPQGRPIQTLENVLVAYDSIISSLFLSGPTSFAPAVYKAIEIVRNSGGQYHILIIIADGQVSM